MDSRFGFLVLVACIPRLTACGATDGLNDYAPPGSSAEAPALPLDGAVSADAGYDGGQLLEEGDALTAIDSEGPGDASNPMDSGSLSDVDAPTDSGDVNEADTPTDSGTMTDAGPADAADSPDAGDPSTRFDVVYIDEFTTAWNRTGLLGFLAIVNTGNKPLDLAKLSIVTYVDDDPDFDSTFEHVVTSTNQLPPNHIGGVVSRDGTRFLLERGFLTEPFIDDDTLFGITFHEHAQPGTDLHAMATLRIDDAEVVLPFTIHFVVEQVTFAEHASRVRSR
jgi:hypothetical protein